MRRSAVDALIETARDERSLRTFRWGRAVHYDGRRILDFLSSYCVHNLVTIIRRLSGSVDAITGEGICVSIKQAHAQAAAAETRQSHPLSGSPAPIDASALVRDVPRLKSIFARFSIASLFLTMLVPLVGAQELSIELNPQKTTVSFVLGDVLHTVRGDFRLRSGHLSIDPASKAIAGSIIVDAASGKSGSNARDKRMRHDILEVQRYPEIAFTPASVTGSLDPSGVSNVRVTGSFLIHGQTHEVTIPMQVRISQDELTAAGTFIVPYVQWGMKNPSNFFLKVNDKVEIDLNAVGSIKRRNSTAP